jgi:hypothetical protein
MRNANHVPVAIELLTRDHGRPEFQKRERAVIEGLRENPGVAFSTLPGELRSDAYAVATFYDSMAILVSFGYVDERMVLSTINYRIRHIWLALEEAIILERRARQAPFFDFLEDLAVRAFATDPNVMHESIGLREMPNRLSSSPPAVHSESAGDSRA